MIGPGADARVLVATRPVDFRKGADSLAALVKAEHGADPFSGVVYVFRAKRADRIKLVWWDGTGLWLMAKRLEQGRFRWPVIQDGVMRLTAAQFGALVEGLAGVGCMAAVVRSRRNWPVDEVRAGCFTRTVLAEADLPDDPALLRAMLVEARGEVAQQQARIVDLEGAGTDARAEIERLTAIIAAFQRHRFGARSEQLDPDQLALALEELDAAVSRVGAGLDASGNKPRAPRARDANRGRLPAHLERVEQVVDVESKACACCGGALHVIGEDVAERLDVVPTTFRVLVTRRPRYGCRACEAAPVQAPAPARIVEGGMPTEALIAHVLVGKYADHLPLYRQAQIYARQGVTLDRSTLADWVGRAAWWLTPLRDHLLADLKRSPRLFADETTAPVLAPGTGRTRTGQLWAYARDDRPWGGTDPPAVAYVYAPDRKAERPSEHLRSFTGVLQVDGYAGYRALGRSIQIHLAFCWSHVRRGFYEIAASRPAATEALVRIAQLYAIEQEIRGHAPDERRAVRQGRSAPLVASLRRFLETSLARASGKGKLAEAIRYALNRWDGLCRFLDDGRVEIDSNIVERSIRPLALNRKNALFAGSDQGGDHWAVIASLIETCKLNRVDPQAWLSATLTRLVAGHPASALDQLMPWTSMPNVA